MYKLLKTHKSGVPVRPVLSMVASPQHKLAKWLVNMLEPVLLKFSIFSLRDSFTFANTVRNLRLSADSCHMCSFDVRSLFTNASLN